MNLERKRVVSSLAHFLYGVLTALSDWYLSISMAILFIIYELDEEWHIKDNAYRDILEYIIGVAIGALALLVQKHIYLCR